MKASKEFQKELFLKFKPALTMKELGFEEPCFYAFLDGILGDNLDFGLCTYTNEIFDEDELKEGLIVLAPLYFQAFSFLRKTYNLFYDNLQYENNEWKFTTYSNNVDDYFQSDSYKTYEEAEEACLNKLIEIAKGK